MMAKKSIILERLSKRGEEENSWAAQQIDICLNAFKKNIKEKNRYKCKYKSSIKSYFRK